MFGAEYARFLTPMAHRGLFRFHETAGRRIRRHRCPCPRARRWAHGWVCGFHSEGIVRPRAVWTSLYMWGVCLVEACCG